jgi:hypothetical protein
MVRWWVGKVVLGLTFFAVATAIFSFVTMLLWNGLIPALFKGPSLTFVQAVGLLVLSHILLRGWSPWRYGNGWRSERWKKRFQDKLASMAPEERERINEAWRRGGCAPVAHSDPKADDPTMV